MVWLSLAPVNFIVIHGQIYLCLVLIHNLSFYCAEEIWLKRHESSSLPRRAQAVLFLLECPAEEARRTDCRGDGGWLPNLPLSGGPSAPSWEHNPAAESSYFQQIHSISTSWPTLLWVPPLSTCVCPSVLRAAVLWLVLSAYISTTVTTGVDPDFAGPELGGGGGGTWKNNTEIS